MSGFRFAKDDVRNALEKLNEELSTERLKFDTVDLDRAYTRCMALASDILVYRLKVAKARREHDEGRKNNKEENQ